MGLFPLVFPICGGFGAAWFNEDVAVRKGPTGVIQRLLEIV
jgi:hypothetical protein